ncbi:MAG: reprolysin-like metallopeptidase, partial [Pyrinomonadaceae bacterium]
MKKVSFLVFVFLICLLFINSQSPSQAVFAQNKFNSFAASKRTNVRKQTALWQQVSEDALKSKDRSLLAPEKYLVFRLNKTALTKLLAEAPAEFTEAVQEKSVIMELPMPDGTFARFRIEESSVLEPDLAARFPEIKSYRGQGIDDASLTTRFDWTPQGFHALILSGSETINLEPAGKSDSSLYVSYYGDDLKDGDFKCLVKDFQNIEPGLPALDAPQVAVGPTLRNYRIAIATTFEYTQTYGGGTVSGTVASLNTWVNNANLIYEKELSIHLNLVNDTDVIYSADRGFTAAPAPDPTADPYDNSNVVNMLNQVIPDLDSKVGSANYDLGHVFGTLSGGASGVAYVGVVCNSGFKGGGATRLGGSVGNSGALGVWVHELGHQFGANHNFNGTQGNCTQRNNATSYESGGGSTIMGYSGICSTDNISNSRDMRFHAMSYAAINSYISGGGSCFIGSVTGNLPPDVNGGGNRNIPKFTPFTLTATASDANGDSLTYNWEQIDAGETFVQNGTSPSYNDAGDPSTTTRPIFLPLPSTPSPSRTFPRLILILDYANDPPDISPFTGLKTAEELPRIGRSINFRVTARDNRIGGGGVNEDTVMLSVDGGSGPFLVTAPNTGVNLSGGTAQTVTWSVNNTNAAPVNAVSVKISLSTDGGTTFPTVLAAITPNDGSETVIIPNITTTTARIKVEAVGNIFFDINDTNFAITAGTGGGAQGFEADVSPRPDGNGSITSTDVSIIQGFQLGQGLPYQSNEFQRADCAPFDTRGDGRVSSIDVSQAQAYQLGFNLTA